MLSTDELKRLNKERLKSLREYEAYKKKIFKTAKAWLKKEQGIDLDIASHQWKHYTLIESSLTSGPVTIQEWLDDDRHPSVKGKTYTVPRKEIIS